ncbi:uncharacterized protein LOC134198090 isoform X2 [Corticium candelabrum]|uniref:uncharacterized protein LOC134198090 isoform X2 n=1 Tax=Corticium candelabrum TaxID=121492 RepID=UPI002E273390|nr:uncharacterized protein LOC134198090 isoform X2 [Corticium candelabrum]
MVFVQCIVWFLFSSLSVADGKVDVTISSSCNLSINVPRVVERGEMRRVDITDAVRLGAVCNDRSPGLYYISRTSTNKWIIFLESGSGCGSIEECNERYMEQKELMTSSEYPETVKGTDVFDADPRLNPDYWDYNFVLIPYCTSDLWIGNSTWNEEEIAKALAGLNFSATAVENQFAFRGSSLFRAVVEELEESSAGLSTAAEVVLAGSSAGGLGVLNQAGWLYERLPASASMSAILDSSWFINFDSTLVESFNFTFLEKYTNYLTHEPCRDNDTLGFPCCVSASCMLTKVARHPLDYPNIPTFVIFSMYDLYIVSESVRSLENETGNVQKLEAFRTIAEYGGAMNYSLETSHHLADNMSYFVPSCLQHVYLATSSLWADGGVLNNSVNSSNHNHTLGNTKYFKHVVKSSTWSETYIKSNTDDNQTSLQCAIHEWNVHIQSGSHRQESNSYPVRYLDTCFGARCNPHCPETVLLGIFNEFWPRGVQFLLVFFVLLVTVLCIFYKTVMFAKMKWLMKDYKRFRDWDKMHNRDQRKGLSSCSARDAIGIAFLHLRYSIRLSPEALSQEKKRHAEKLAAEEESRELLGYGDESDEDDGKENSKKDHRVSFSESLHPKGLINRFLCCFRTKSVNSSSNMMSSDLVLSSQDIELGLNKLDQSREPDGSDDAGNGHILTQRSATVPEALLRKMNRDAEFGEQIEARPRSHTVLPTVTQSAVSEVDVEKTIINGISSYFNPRQLVAIMGPSGCGKTTFLDLLTGRRRTGHQQGEIFINGIPSNLVHDWYIKHTGYVLQLAVPYYEELTVSQNLLLSAVMRLPCLMTQEDRFERVEEVMEETGLTSLKDTIVGGLTGPGLSGGQKRRLAVAIQLLSMPKVIFLDEPTSGLDASSSMELLQHLRYMAMSGRLVVLTIHQPRLEIFHMFDRILFLCQGRVAYYGSPTEAPALFLEAYRVAKLEGEAPVLDQNKNPADVIMDMLGCEKYRAAILKYYEDTQELKSVENAIKLAKQNDSLEKLAIENEKDDSGHMNRFLALETRASQRSNLSQTIYLPFIFFAYAIILGLAYLQADTVFLIMSAFCIFSFASSIFMFPAVYTHLSKSLEIYQLEREDGIGKSFEVLLQTFMRYVAIAAGPLVLSAFILYIMVVKPEFWSFMGFFNLAVFSLAVNQTWVAISIMVVCLFPVHGHRVAPLTSCAAGFAGGFLIPVPKMKAYFAWLFYINPSFYGYASIMRLIIPGIETGCDFQSTIECYPNTGSFWIEHFGFEFIQPYLSLMIIMVITFVTLILAWIALEHRYCGINWYELICHCRLQKPTDSSGLSQDNSKESSVEPEEVNSEDEFHVAPRVNSSDEDKETTETTVLGDTAMKRSLRLRRYSDGRGLRKRQEASMEEVELAAQKASEDLALKEKRKLQRQTTHTVLLPAGEHSVFNPNSAEGNGRRSSFTRLSRRDRLRRTARETQQKQQQLQSRMKKFHEIDDANDPDKGRNVEDGGGFNEFLGIHTNRRSPSRRVRSERHLSPSAYSMSSFEPLKSGSSQSVPNVKRLVHSTTTVKARVIQSVADLRRGSGSSGVSFDVSKLAPGSDDDSVSSLLPRTSRRSSVTFAPDVVQLSKVEKRQGFTSPLIPKSAMKRPQSLQNSPHATPSPLSRKKSKKVPRVAMTPDVDPDVMSAFTRRTKQKFVKKFDRRSSEREKDEMATSIIQASSSDDETFYSVNEVEKGVKKRSNVSLSTLRGEVADNWSSSPASPSGEPVLTSLRVNASPIPAHLLVKDGGIESSGSDTGDPTIRVATSRSPSPCISLGDTHEARERPSTLALRQRPSQTGGFRNSQERTSDDAVAPSGQTPVTPKISITECLSIDQVEPPAATGDGSLKL